MYLCLYPQQFITKCLFVWYIFNNYVFFDWLSVNWVAFLYLWLKCYVTLSVRLQSFVHFFPVGNLTWMIEEAIYVKIYSFRNPEYLGDIIRLDDKINNTWLELYFCPFFLCILLSRKVQNLTFENYTQCKKTKNLWDHCVDWPKRSNSEAS